MCAKSATPRVRVWARVRVISLEGRGSVFDFVWKGRCLLVLW